MGTFLPVLHSAVARPVTLAEFTDAVRATCPPRFPHLRGTNKRPVALAISGGVDSMALAFLASQLQRQQHQQTFRIADNPIANFVGIVIDHHLRSNSSEEAVEVCRALRQLNIKPIHNIVNWRRELNIDPPVDDPKLETLARQMRYRHLGSECAFRRLGSLFVAHHADDQYETVLMRLLGGHKGRGLRGMKPSSEIPECEGMYGTFRSGFLDDQLRDPSYFANVGNDRDRKRLRKLFQRLDDDEGTGSFGPDGVLEPLPATDDKLKNFYAGSKNMPLAGTTTVHIDDGGVMVYRPLLEFSKDRLIATCLENRVPWFEDPTNNDATLTTRNAIRQLRQHQLPAVLQKPAIWALSKRCDRKYRAIEDEARRLWPRVVIHNFDTQAGTLLVRFPDISSLVSASRVRSGARQVARLARAKEVAAEVVRQVMALVSPEHNSPLVSGLQDALNSIFPSLSTILLSSREPIPKPFNVGGVLFHPVVDEPTSLVTDSGEERAESVPENEMSWYLTRQPYPSPSQKPLPVSPVRYNGPLDRSILPKNGRGNWSVWMAWQLWDGRYWIRLRHRLAFQPFIAPLRKEYLKRFRDRLAEADKKSFDLLLKLHAPGKTRFTLPALYIEADVDLGDQPVVPEYPYRLPEKREASLTASSSVLCLPTLGVGRPDLDEYLQFEVRYKRADRGLLNKVGTFKRAPFMRPVIRRRERGLRKRKPLQPVPRLNRGSSSRDRQYNAEEVNDHHDFVLDV